MDKVRVETKPERRLGDILRETRVARGLELSDVAEVTHVRKEYLQALDEGRYEDLPEDVYARNFVRLYAQTLGISDTQLLEKFKKERHREQALPPPAPVGAASPPVLANRAAPQAMPAHLDKDFWTKDPSKGRRNPLIWIAVLGLLLLALGVAWWAADRRASGSVPAPLTTDTADAATPPVIVLDAPDTEIPTTPAPAENPAAEVPAQPAVTSPSTVTLAVGSTPPGAEVSVDGFYLGNTPLEFPIRARESGLVQVRLEGYQTAEFSEALSTNRTLEVNLTPLSGGNVQAVGGGQGRIVLVVESSPSWLEVWSGGARNEGERLLYTTAQPGERFEFDLPVYVHAGAAGSIRVSVNGQPQGTLGSGGEVVGRLFR
jgi:cytoskeleton protein RodZ